MYARIHEAFYLWWVLLTNCLPWRLFTLAEIDIWKGHVLLKVKVKNFKKKKKVDFPIFDIHVIYIPSVCITLSGASL